MHWRTAMRKNNILVCSILAIGMTACSVTQSYPAKPDGVTVFAAASLHNVLPELIKELDPDATVTFNFDGSSGLVDQLSSGAPADLLLTANESNMTKAIDKKLVSHATMFASNTLVLVVPRDNPGSVTGFSDGSLDSKRLVICAPEVPCGSATHKLAELNDVILSPSSEEQSVTSVLGKVTSAEADAGVVYRTDAAAARDKIQVIDIDNANQVVNNYMVGLTRNSHNEEAAQHILDLIKSEAGQRKLGEYGFSVTVGTRE